MIAVPENNFLSGKAKIGVFWKVFDDLWVGQSELVINLRFLQI